MPTESASPERKRDGDLDSARRKQGGCGVLRDPVSAANEDVGCASPVLGIRRAAQERESESGVSVEALGKLSAAQTSKRKEQLETWLKEVCELPAHPERSRAAATSCWSCDGLGPLICGVDNEKLGRCHVAIRVDNAKKRCRVATVRACRSQSQHQSKSSTESWELVEPKGGGACNGWLRFEHYTL